MRLGRKISCAVLIVLAVLLADCSISQRAMIAKTAAFLAEADGKTLIEVFSEAEAVCLVPEYKSVADFIEPFGFEIERNRYVGELETGLVVLGSSKEDFFLLTTSQGGAYVGEGCFDPGQHRFKVEMIVHPETERTYQKLAVVKIR